MKGEGDQESEKEASNSLGAALKLIPPSKWLNGQDLWPLMVHVSCTYVYMGIKLLSLLQMPLVMP